MNKEAYPMTETGSIPATTGDYLASAYNIWQEEEGKCFIINTLTRAVIEVNPPEKAYIIKILQNDASLVQDRKYHDYRGILISQGFMVSSQYDEKQILAYCYHQTHFSDKILKLTILPTLRCNFHCPYCFETEKGMHWDDESLTRLKRFAEKTFPGRKLIQLSFFGGEPLLEWKRMRLFLDTCLDLQQKHKFDFYTGLTTNGYLLDEEKIRLLADVYSCIGVQVTIDGCRRTHNQTRVLHGNAPTFEKVLGNFKALLAARAARRGKNWQLNLRVNLLNNSLEEVQDFLNMFDDSEKQFFGVYFRPVYNTQQFCARNNNYTDLEEFYKLLDAGHFRRAIIKHLRYAYCEGDSGANTLQLMPDLSFWKCMSDTGCREACIGQIEEDGTMQLEMEKVEKWSRNDPFAHPVCRNCSYLPLCFGGCPLEYLKTAQKTCFYEKKFNLVKHFRN